MNINEQYANLLTLIETSTRNVSDTTERLANIENLKYRLKQYDDLDLILYTEVSDSKRLVGLKRGFIFEQSTENACTIKNGDGKNLDVFEVDPKGNVFQNKLILSINLKDTDYVRVIRGKMLGNSDFSLIAKGEGSYPLGLFNLVLEDTLTNMTITNNAKLVTAEIKLNMSFNPKLEPDVGDVRAKSLFDYEVNLTKDGGKIPFVNNTKIVGYGSYELKVTLSEKAVSSNKRVITTKFTLKKELTDLNTFELNYKNAYDNQPISEGQQYQEGIDVVQPVIANTIPNDLVLEKQTLYHNGALMEYNPSIDTLYSDGNYTMNSVISRKSNIESNLPLNSSKYTLNFTIKAGQITVSNAVVRVINEMDGANIPPSESVSITYKEEQICFDWEEPEGIIVTDAVLSFTPAPSEEDPTPTKTVLSDFSRGESVYDNYGVYELKLLIAPIDNPDYIPTSNENVRLYNVAITYKETPLDINSIELRENITGLEINENNNIFYDKANPTAAYLLDDGISFIKEITLNKNGNKVEGFKNGDTITELGSYVLTMKVIDVKVHSNTITKSASFDIRTKPLDMYEKEIIVKNGKKNKEITNGQIFDVYKDSTGNHIPPLSLTWNNIDGATESYTLYFNNAPKSDYVKGQELVEIGAYRLHITFTDPTYSKNKLEKTVVFELRLNLDDMYIDPNLIAYLNGIPYQIGTPIDVPGSYNLLAIRRQDSNFNYSKKEVNFTIVDVDTLQKPLINCHPEENPNSTALIEIIYPNFSHVREYRINNEGWIPYTIPFEINKNCTVYARCKDTINNFWSESLREITNIDSDPPSPPELLGFYKTGEQIYHSVTPMVKHVYGTTYTATLNGQPFVLGSAIYNTNQEVKSYDLIVTATKKINGRTSQTTKTFKLDSIPPVRPIIENIKNNEIQGTSSVTPTVSNLNEDDYIYECYLNDRPYILGTPITEPGSYRLSVTAIKKTNGLRRTVVVTFIISSSRDKIIGRVTMIPIFIENIDVIKPKDNEIVIDLANGDIYIHRDGILISKTKELREKMSDVNKYLNDLSIDLNRCVSRVEALTSLKNSIHATVTFLGEKIYEMNADISTIEDNVKKFVFDNYTELEKRRADLVEIEKLSNRNAIEIDNIDSLLIGKIDGMKDMITRISNNADGVAELAYYKSILPPNPKKK